MKALIYVVVIIAGIFAALIIIGYLLPKEKTQSGIVFKSEDCIEKIESLEARDYNTYCSVLVDSFDNNESAWKDLKQYGRGKGYKEAATTVYFFEKESPLMRLYLDEGSYFDKFCIAQYLRFSNGKEMFIAFPFIDSLRNDSI